MNQMKRIPPVGSMVVAAKAPTGYGRESITYDLAAIWGKEFPAPVRKAESGVEQVADVVLRIVNGYGYRMSFTRVSQHDAYVTFLFSTVDDMFSKNAIKMQGEIRDSLAQQIGQEVTVGAEVGRLILWVNKS